MKDVMNLGSRGVLQAVGHINAFKHPVWPKVPWRQLADTLVGDTGGRALVKTRPCPVSDRQGDIAVALIVVLLHVRLGNEKTVPDLFFLKEIPQGRPLKFKVPHPGFEPWAGASRPVAFATAP